MSAAVAAITAHMSSVTRIVKSGTLPGRPASSSWRMPLGEKGLPRGLLLPKPGPPWPGPLLPLEHLLGAVPGVGRAGHVGVADDDRAVAVGHAGVAVAAERAGVCIARAGLAPRVVGDGVLDVAVVVGDDVRGAEVVVVERLDGVDPAACGIGEAEDLRDDAAVGGDAVGEFEPTVHSQPHALHIWKLVSLLFKNGLIVR
jgi:hypothetical protein